MGNRRHDRARKRNFFSFLSLEVCSKAGLPYTACAETSHVATQMLLLSNWLGLFMAYWEAVVGMVIHYFALLSIFRLTPLSLLPWDWLPKASAVNLCLGLCSVGNLSWGGPQMKVTIPSLIQEKITDYLLCSDTVLINRVTAINMKTFLPSWSLHSNWGRHTDFKQTRKYRLV